MNDSTQQVQSASKEMTADSRTIMNQIALLQNESESMQQGIREMSASAEKINLMGNSLSEISRLMEDSIGKMGQQVDQFEV